MTYGLLGKQLMPKNNTKVALSNYQLPENETLETCNDLSLWKISPELLRNLLNSIDED